MAVSDYSTSPNSNTSIGGINIGEGCPPGNINNALRQLMADMKGYDAQVIPFTPPSGWNAETVRSAIIEAFDKARAAIPGNASASAAGLMSASDKNKLNNIAAGANAIPSFGQGDWNSNAHGMQGSISPHQLTDRLWGFNNERALGWNQGWHDVFGQRGTYNWYHNNTPRPISVSVSCGSGNFINLMVSADGGGSWAVIASNNGTYGGQGFVTGIVPANWWYRIEAGGQNPVLTRWMELR